MTRKILSPWLFASLVGAAVCVGFPSYGVFVHAQDTGGAPSAASSQETEIRGITFPIPELGNCATKDECRAYCNETAHIEACVNFAKARGLMNPDEAARAQKFREKLQSGGGPGGCTSPEACQTFCSNAANLEVCLKFAKAQGLKDENVEQGDKILAYIKAGGTMPGGCDSKESCKAYCGDFSHAEECFNFAKNAGITQFRGGAKEGSDKLREVSLGQLQQIAQLAESGQTPGGCKSKDECETYCGSPDHREECVAFGVKIGLITPEQAVMIRETGGTGPGGCNSPEGCRTYCDDPNHRDECFKFAEDHGFISHDEADQAQNGLVRLRAGLENAPPGIAECLKSTVGPNIIADIQSGKLVPGPDIGDRVRACFEKFGRPSDAQQIFQNAPAGVLACLKEKLGSQFDEIRSGSISPTPEMADTLRVCFQQEQIKSGFQGETGGGPGPGDGVHPAPEVLKNFLRTAPAEIVPCLKEQLGDDFAKLQSGQSTEVDTSKVKICFEKFRPPTATGSSTSGENRPQPLPLPTPNLPPVLVACLNAVLGEEGIAKLNSGQITPDEKLKVSNCVSQSGAPATPSQP